MVTLSFLEIELSFLMLFEKRVIELLSQDPQFIEIQKSGFQRWMLLLTKSKKVLSVSDCYTKNLPGSRWKWPLCLMVLGNKWALTFVKNQELCSSGDWWLLKIPWSWDCAFDFCVRSHIYRLWCASICQVWKRSLFSGPFIAGEGGRGERVFKTR